MSQACEPKPAVMLDLTGHSCPVPVLGLRRLLMHLAEGEVVLLISDCPATPDDLAAWARRTGHRVVLAEHVPGSASRYYVRRGRRAVRPDARAPLS